MAGGPKAFANTYLALRQQRQREIEHVADQEMRRALAEQQAKFHREKVAQDELQFQERQKFDREELEFRRQKEKSDAEEAKQRAANATRDDYMQRFIKLAEAGSDVRPASDLAASAAGYQQSDQDRNYVRALAGFGPAGQRMGPIGVPQGVPLEVAAAYEEAGGYPVPEPEMGKMLLPLVREKIEAQRAATKLKEVQAKRQQELIALDAKRVSAQADYDLAKKKEAEAKIERDDRKDVRDQWYKEERLNLEKVRADAYALNQKARASGASSTSRAAATSEITANRIFLSQQNTHLADQIKSTEKQLDAVRESKRKAESIWRAYQFNMDPEPDRTKDPEGHYRWLGTQREMETAKQMWMADESEIRRLEGIKKDTEAERKKHQEAINAFTTKLNNSGKVINGTGAPTVGVSGTLPPLPGMGIVGQAKFNPKSTAPFNLNLRRLSKDELWSLLKK